MPLFGLTRSEGEVVNVSLENIHELSTRNITIILRIYCRSDTAAFCAAFFSFIPSRVIPLFFLRLFSAALGSLYLFPPGILR